MKINPIHSVQAYRKLQEVQEREDKTAHKKQDQVQISSEAKIMAQKTQISPERMEKVNEVKAQIEKGTYEVDSKAVAQKLYDFWNN